MKGLGNPACGIKFASFNVTFLKSNKQGTRIGGGNVGGGRGREKEAKGRRRTMSPSRDIQETLHLSICNSPLKALVLRSPFFSIFQPP